jgi:hypothetical protein
MAESDFTTWIREKMTKEVVIAFVLGAVVGLVVLGWWLWPVKWTNADPADLRPSHKEGYLQMIADSYALTGNAELARARLEVLKVPGEADTALSAMLDTVTKARLDAGRADEAQRLQGLSSAVILPPPPTPQPTVAEPATTTGSQVLRIAGIVFFLFLFGAGVVLLLTQLQKREATRRRRVPLREPKLEREFPEPAPSESALALFETTYNRGDEGYDVSTGVESSTGEFLGECGVSALEDASVGGLDGVAAFELWLFDKDDVRTEAKVLLSEGAFADETLREKLDSKGELIRAERGQVLTLVTANLRLDATITELEYEGGSSSAFAKLGARLEISGR